MKFLQPNYEMDDGGSGSPGWWFDHIRAQNRRDDMGRWWRRFFG